MVSFIHPTLSVRVFLNCTARPLDVSCRRKLIMPNNGKTKDDLISLCNEIIREPGLDNIISRRFPSLYAFIM